MPSDAARAVAEDLLAARWVLPVLRILAEKPCRFTGIRTAIRGVSANVLIARLRSLEEAGIVQRWTLPPPADCQVYGLTELGEGVRPILRAIEHWARMIEPSLARGTVPDARAPAGAR